MSCWVLLSKSFEGWNGGDSLRQCRTACGESRGAKKLQKYLKVCDTCKHWWMSVVQTCVYVNAQSFIQPVRPPSVLFPHSLKRDLLEPVQIGPLKWSLAFSLWCLGKLDIPESSVLSLSVIMTCEAVLKEWECWMQKKNIMPACCGSSIFSESKSNSILVLLATICWHISQHCNTMTFVSLFAWAEDFSVTVVVSSCEISRPSILYTEPSSPRGCKASCIHPVALSLTCPAVQSYFYQSETAPARVTSTEPFASFGFPRRDNLVKVNKALKVHLLVAASLQEIQNFARKLFIFCVIYMYRQTARCDLSVSSSSLPCVAFLPIQR